MRRIGLPILILATVLMQGLAYAQSTMVAKADVPFAFTAGGKTIAAGESVINTIGSTDGALRVGNLDTNEAAYVVALTTESLAPAERTVLVFNKYGDRYFLAAIKRGGNSSGYQLPESKVEKELRAQNVTAPEEILLPSK